MPLFRYSSALVAVLALSFANVQSVSADPDRTEQMQNTIQELSIQLGDALRKIRDLEAQLKQESSTDTCDCKEVQHVAPSPRAVSKQAPAVTPVPQSLPQRVEVPPVSCAVSDLKTQIDRRNDATVRRGIFLDWMSERGASCSKQELRQLKKIAESLADSDDARGIVDYYLDR